MLFIYLFIFIFFLMTSHPTPRTLQSAVRSPHPALRPRVLGTTFLKLRVQNTQNKCSALCSNVCFESHDILFRFKVPTAIYNILRLVYYPMYSAQFYSRA